MAAYIPPKPWLNIIYEDNFVIAVNKPPGLLSVPGRGNTPDKRDCIMSRIKTKIPRAKYIHRLDRDTSGVILVATSRKSENIIRDQFRRHLTYKFYVARVWGHPEEDEAEIDLPLIIDWPNRPRHKVCFETGKPSKTRFQVLERYDDSTSRLLLTPATGRTHQLRVHLRAIGHPILGDSLYAPPDVQAMASRLLLHGETFLLRHPHYKTPFHIYCKPDF